ncbi:hypothetical protein [Eggerthella sinensis]|uniref:Uncharacterized protein n=1 Tax=Eggerthella sinensis TaxID=242230 RepID=A0A3N0J2M9_9ACTN|nr:hypothetical protein [Eggerthella sinensis]RDB68744.1 hypothetical protein C1876_08630 [Eggerthella sinensis]RNM42980.1 hypothetical protein DMP09_02615 [Eggerthella sinensis]
MDNTARLSANRNSTASQPWGEAERIFLKNAAGKLTPKELGRALDRDNDSIERIARESHLSLDVRTVRLVWCDKCATWRTSIDKRTGWCRVCTMREQLTRREEACADALASMPPRQRAIYEKTEAERATRRLPPHPSMRYLSPASPAERCEEEAAYLEAMETWECRVLKLRYDAAKTRLRRMREKTGTNPRKKPSEK